MGHIGSSGTGCFSPFPDFEPHDVGEGLAARSLQTPPSPSAGSGHGVLGCQPPAFLWTLDPGQWRNVSGAVFLRSGLLLSNLPAVKPILVRGMALVPAAFCAGCQPRAILSL